jgi:hypothetical protein
MSKSYFTIFTTGNRFDTEKGIAVIKDYKVEYPTRDNDLSYPIIKEISVFSGSRMKTIEYPEDKISLDKFYYHDGTDND